MIESNLNQGDVRVIIADAIEGYEFDQWTGDTQYIADPTSKHTTITMPNDNIEVTASYIALVQVVNLGYIYNNNTLSGTGSNSITSSDDWIVPMGAANTYEYGQLQIYSSNIASKFLVTGSNEYGFNGKTGGARGINGVFAEEDCSFSTLNTPLGNANRAVYISVYSGGFEYADTFGISYPVRLVRPSTILTHGQTGTYIGNDGREYPTICIGTQEWLSCNLAETELRGHIPIPTITDNADWTANLGGLAKCAFNNDENNVFE